MSIAPLEINLELVNQKVKFTGVSNLNPENPITFDYLPPVGDGQGFLGLEMLVMSFAGCVSTAIVGILRRMGKNISEYKMSVTGIKREKPLSLEKIIFEVTVKSTDIRDEDIESVMKRAEEISPLWIAIRNNVQVSGGYKINSI